MPPDLRDDGGMARRINPRVDIGHVHLKVSDLERAVAFYSGVLGFELTQRYGSQAAFLSAGGYHHHIGLNTWESRDGHAPPPGTTGLYHFAIRYPDRAALGDALRRLRAAGVALDGASDHGVSEALYLRDPDGNGIELYWDRTVAAGAPADEAIPVGAGPLTDETRQLLLDLRVRLLQLHKVLLDDTRAAYEMDRGHVGSNANLLQLVINDPWFAWLHALSELVVRIDETVEPGAPSTQADAVALVDHVERLLTASETGDGFHRRYFEALQRQPAVVLAHAEVRRVLKKKSA